MNISNHIHKDKDKEKNEDKIPVKKEKSFKFDFNISDKHDKDIKDSKIDLSILKLDSNQAGNSSNINNILNISINSNNKDSFLSKLTKTCGSVNNKYNEASLINKGTDINKYIERKDTKKLIDLELHNHNNINKLKANSIVHTFRKKSVDNIREVLDLKVRQSEIDKKKWAIKHNIDYKTIVDKNFLNQLNEFDEEKSDVLRNQKILRKKPILNSIQAKEKILNKTVFFNNKRNELNKIRDDLSKLMIYQNNSFLYYTGVKKEENINIAEMTSFKKLHNTYKIPDHDHVNKKVINLVNIKSNLINDPDYSKIFNINSDHVIKEEKSSRDFHILNNINEFDNKLSKDFCDKYLMLNEYMKNNVNNVVETIKAQEIFQVLKDAENIINNNERMKKLKIWNLSDGVASRFVIENEPSSSSRRENTNAFSQVKFDENTIIRSNIENEEIDEIALKKEKEEERKKEIQEKEKKEKMRKLQTISRQTYFVKTDILLESRILPLNIKPCCRTFFSFSLVGNSGYLFGGIGSGRLNDLWELDLSGDTYSWKLMNPTGFIPFKRFGHTSATFNNELIIWGGEGLESHKEEVVIYDTRKIIFYYS